jgi:hypothetical protein
VIGTRRPPDIRISAFVWSVQPNHAILPALFQAKSTS